MKNNMWSLKFTAAIWVLIPIAVAINCAGKLLTSLLKLPLWLDSVGTVIAGIMAGPVAGSIAGAFYNIAYGFYDPISYVYALSSIVIGITAGVLAHYGWFKRLLLTIPAGLIIGFATSVISTPLNVTFWGGKTGNAWGDALFTIVLEASKSEWLASFADEISVDIQDKLIVAIICFIIYKKLPVKITDLYSNNDEEAKTM